jgi:single-strand selective monofunctional uracil DNA glycosylase
MVAGDLLGAAERLRAAVAELRYGPPVAHVYNPLDYAWGAHRMYLERFGHGRREVVLVGMNPGPWGMVQTGVPFGDVEAVRDWMGIEAAIGKPAIEHPRRPVRGFACTRREVSGQRLWGWARKVCGPAPRFFAQFFVVNHCPLCFLDASGSNLTPDRLPVTERRQLLQICDRALAETLEIVGPRYVLGIGRFAAGRVSAVLQDSPVVTGAIPHPSPASPSANRGWEAQVEKALEAVGVVVRCRS